jgi:hypothetical protein
MKVYLAEQSQGQGDTLLAASRYRPFIGISISSRTLPLAATVPLLAWVLRSPTPILPILIADEIALINYRAFKRYGGGGFAQKVQRDAQLQIDSWQAAALQLPAGQAERVRFVRWPEIVTPTYQQQVEVVRSEFAQGGLLQKTILGLVEDYIRSTGKTVSSQRCFDLSEYIIQELPSLLYGIEVDGIRYQTLVYPTAHLSEMHALVLSIRRKPGFAALREALQACVIPGVSVPLEHNKIIQFILSGERHPAPPADQQPALAHSHQEDHGQLAVS